MVMDVEDVDIVALAHETLSHIEGQVGAKAVVLRYSGPTVAPLLRTDAESCDRSSSTSSGNAIKFTSMATSPGARDGR